MTSLDRARDFLKAHQLIDGHNDLPWAMYLLNNYDLDDFDVAHRQSRGQTDIPRLREGGVGGQFWSVFVPSDLNELDAVQKTLAQIDFVHQIVQRYPDDLGLALTAAEAREVFSIGRIASLLGAEGGQSIGCSMATLRSLHQLGVRYMTLTHNDNNPWADSATDVAVHNGLSGFGKEVVREMNRVGMLVDLSHVSTATMSDALDTTEAPVIMSHSSCRAVTDHVRNVPDDILKRLSTNGGVCMIAFVPYFISEELRLWSEEGKIVLAEQGVDVHDLHAFFTGLDSYALEHPAPEVTVEDVADHVEHARDVAGLAHVGIGADYDGCPDFPVGMTDVSGYPLLFAELLDRGWSESELAAIAGGNVLRALGDAENVAQKLQVSRGPSNARMEDF